MSSDMKEAYRYLSRGYYAERTYRHNNNCNRLLEVLNIRVNNDCYICGSIAHHVYNNYKVCYRCLKNIQAFDPNQSVMCANVKLMKYDNYWVSKDECNNLSEVPYCSINPAIMLQIVFLGTYFRSSQINVCISCKKGIYKGYYIDNYHACTTCFKASVLYFDFNYEYYWYLKMILIEDVAFWALKHYYDVKIINGTNHCCKIVHNW